LSADVFFLIHDKISSAATRVISNIGSKALIGEVKCGHRKGARFIVLEESKFDFCIREISLNQSDLSSSNATECKIDDSIIIFINNFSSNKNIDVAPTDVENQCFRAAILYDIQSSGAVLRELSNFISSRRAIAINS